MSICANLENYLNFQQPTAGVRLTTQKGFIMIFTVFSTVVSIVVSLLIFEDKQLGAVGVFCALGSMNAIAARMLSEKNSEKLDALLKKAGFSDKEIERLN